MIEKLFNQGMRLKQIAREIGRSATAITTEVKRCKGKIYNAAEAQKLYDELKKIKYENLAKTHSARTRQALFGYKQRIESLEMHVEILADKIKDMMKNDQENKRL